MTTRVRWVDKPWDEVKAHFNQTEHNKQLWETKFRGNWQEIIATPVDPKRVDSLGGCPGPFFEIVSDENWGFVCPHIAEID